MEEKIKIKIKELLDKEGQYHFADRQRDYLFMIIDLAFKEIKNEKKKVRNGNSRINK